MTKSTRSTAISSASRDERTVVLGIRTTGATSCQTIKDDMLVDPTFGGSAWAEAKTLTDLQAAYKHHVHVKGMYTENFYSRVPTTESAEEWSKTNDEAKKMLEDLRKSGIRVIFAQDSDVSKVYFANMASEGRAAEAVEVPVEETVKGDQE